MKTFSRKTATGISILAACLLFSGASTALAALGNAHKFYGKIVKVDEKKVFVQNAGQIFHVDRKRAEAENPTPLRVGQKIAILLAPKTSTSR